MNYPVILFISTLLFSFCHGWSSYGDKSKGNVENKEDALSELFPNKRITWKEINKTIDFVRNIYDNMATREKILGYAEIQIEAGTPSHGFFIDNFPDPEATEKMKLVLEVVAASAQIAYEYCTAELYLSEECGNKLKLIPLWQTQLKEACHKLGKVCTKEETHAKYRAIDGSCNDHTKGEKGQSFTVYGRLLYPDYLGGIKEMRRSVTKQVLPSARLITSNLDLNGIVDKKRSLAVLFWGQFLEHDLCHTAISKMVHTGKPIECCDPDGRTFLPRYEHPFCMPIAVPSKDPYYGNREVSCISYVRSIPGIGPDCSMGPMEQINQATHFLDASQIYGTTKAKSDHLREFSKGQLKGNDSKNSTCLPISKNPHFDCQQRGYNAPCYLSGDKRVNSDPHVTALYTVWFREHNRVAAKLAEINPMWDDEVLFQEARRIVVAEMQHVTYNEWIPAVLGVKISKSYKSGVDSSVTNEFATAAIRALQSSLLGKLSLVYEEDKFMYHDSSMDALLREMMKNKYSGRTLYYIGKLRDMTYGLDTLSLDIQRGRDHGLPSYKAYRTFCGLKDFDSFHDLESFMLPKAVEVLKKTYRSVEDIDLLVGGLVEKPGKGLFGPTITCILKEQFERTLSSDRYFFTNKDQPMPFSESQINEIKKVTFARIICDNVDKIDKIQPKVFEATSQSNIQEHLCESKVIPKLNLALWSTNRFVYT